MKVSMGPAPSNVCASKSPCAWRVCVALDLDSTDPVCTKGTGTVSHTCKKNEMTCGGGTWKSALEMASLADGFTMCQTGAPGDTLQFLLKDGSGCKNSPTSSLAIAGAGSSTTMQCAPSTTKTCTGNGIGVECVWSVTLPASCPVVVPQASPAASPAKAGTNVTVSPANQHAASPTSSSSPISTSSGSSTSTSTGAGSSSDIVISSGDTAAGDMMGSTDVIIEGADVMAGTMVDTSQVEDCSLLQSMVPQRLVAYQSDPVPSCDIGNALALLGPDYGCQRPSARCQFLQCSETIPDSVLADLKSRTC